MNRLTTDTPNGNFETMMNFAYAKNGAVWIRGADDGKDAELCAYIAKHAFYLELCGITNKDDVIEACGAADCFCELGALFAAATQAAELRARLAAYEDTGLEPEEIKSSDALLRGFIDLSRRHARTLPWIERVMIADREARLLVLPCKVGDTIYEIDLPEYGVIVCKVIWIDYYIGPAAHVQGNEMVAAVSVSVEVIDGHGKGSCYAFEQSDFGKTVFLTREDAEKALGGGTNDKP